MVKKTETQKDKNAREIWSLYSKALQLKHKFSNKKKEMMFRTMYLTNKKSSLNKQQSLIDELAEIVKNVTPSKKKITIHTTKKPKPPPKKVGHVVPKIKTILKSFYIKLLIKRSMDVPQEVLDKRFKKGKKSASFVIEFKILATQEEADYLQENVKIEKPSPEERNFDDFPPYVQYMNILSKTEDPHLSVYLKTCSYIEYIIILRKSPDIGQIIRRNFIGALEEHKRKMDELRDALLEDEYEHTKKDLIGSRYIERIFNNDCKGFNDIIKNNKYSFENSCVINCILNKYKAYFDNKRPILTRELILKTINREDLLKNEITPLSINAIIPFFEKYKLDLFIIDELGNVIIDLKFNLQRPLYIIVHNHHFELINANIKTIAHTIRFQDLPDEEIQYDISDNFYIKEDKEKEINIYCLNSIEELIDLIKSIECEEKTFDMLIILKDDDIIHAVYSFIQSGLYPKITRDKHGIKSFYLHLKKDNCLFKITVKSQQLCSEYPEIKVNVDNTDDYLKIINANDTLQRNIFKKKYLSSYSELDQEIEEEYNFTPKNYTFIKPNVKTYEIDMNKCYTHIFSSIKKIPIFNSFDVFTKYNGETIENLNYYIIQTKKKNILLTNKYERIYGFTLKLMDVTDYEIIYVKRPSNIIDVNFKAIIDELYTTTINDNKHFDAFLKKHMVNIMIGILEKKYNQKHTNIIFDNLNDAQLYNTIYDGCVREVFEDVFEHDLYNEDDDYIGPQSNKTPLFYMLDLVNKKKLVNGFKYIKDIIYSIQDANIFKMMKLLNKNNVKVYGIKTDAFYVDEEGLNIIKKLKILGSKIGQYKYNEKNMNLDIFYNDKEINDNKLIQLQNNATTIELKNEFNINEVSNIILKNKTWIQGGAGSGKSTALINTAINNDLNLLMITPYNTLCEAINKKNISNVEAITLHNLLGLMCNDEINEGKKSYDITEYDIICFDEVFLIPVSLLEKIQKFINNNKDKIYACTGDITQLKPINEQINNISNYEEYKISCVQQVFNMTINLKINKRLKNEEDRALYNMMINDILNSNNQIKTLRKYLPQENFIYKYNDVKTIKNLTYYNHTSKLISSIVHKKLYDDKTYFIGLKVVYRGGIKFKGKQKFITNYTYEITNIKDDKYTLKYDDVSTTITKQDLQAFFILPYSSTIHSAQGTDIDEKYTIFNVGSARFTNKTLLVAITRATEFKNIYIYVHSERELNSISKSTIEFYLKQKIANYKIQDAIKNRKFIEEEYIDLKWMLNFPEECPRCNTAFEFIMDDEQLKSNLTCQRIDNSIAHIKSNASFLCNKCNSQLH